MSQLVKGDLNETYVYMRLSKASVSLLTNRHKTYLSTGNSPLHYNRPSKFINGKNHLH